MSSKKSKKAQENDRRTRAAAIQAQQKRSERRKSALILGGAVLIGLAIIGAAAFAVLDQSQENSEPIAGLQEYDDLGRDHVEGVVDYEQSPSVGGDHNAVWANCGFYDEPVAAENATHSLEHGAVWIGYAPDLDQGQVDDLRDLADSHDYLLVSPVEGMDSPITLSAWGYQLAVDDAGDSRINRFIRDYQQGPQTPEPGASCAGGVGSPL
jgi:hypothetical protein